MQNDIEFGEFAKPFQKPPRRAFVRSAGMPTRALKCACARMLAFGGRPHPQHRNDARSKVDRRQYDGVG